MRRIDADSPVIDVLFPLPKEGQIYRFHRVETSDAVTVTVSDGIAFERSVRIDRQQEEPTP